MKRALVATAAVLAAVVFFLLFTLPSAPRTARWTGSDAVVRRTVGGALHVHSTASDGSADRAGIAAAARRAGLSFAILTDHGDGAAAPAEPAYIDGVLCVDGVEISTNGGHYIALGMPEAPYPLGGEAGAVVEDVRRLGGIGIVAHPDSLKRELAWSDWTLPVDGLEWINVDTEWRDESRAGLARALFYYLLRPGPAIASILDRPTATLIRWEHLALDRTLVGLPGHDAHGGIGGAAEGTRRSVIPGIPSYEASFRAFSLHAVLDAPFSGHAKPDADRLVDAIRSGRVYTVVDGLAGPGLLDFSAEEPGGAVRGMGSVLKPGPVRLKVHASMPEGADLFILQNGAELARQREGTFDREIQGRGAVRVEIQIPGAPGIPPVPWLVSNPIYFLDESRTTAEPKPAVDGVPVAIATTWHAEKDPSSAATASASGDRQRLEYRLRPGERASQFAALAADLGPHETFGYIAFTGRGSGPMRVSVQLRYAGSRGGRWGSSVYLDGTSRDVTVPLERLQPLDHQDRPAEETSGAGTLLFVVDLTHAKPGQAGTFEISGLRFLR